MHLLYFYYWHVFCIFFFLSEANCNHPAGVRQVVEGDISKVTPDVAVTISKQDLMAILEGTLAPLQAYLSGHLTVQGNVQMLMGLESLRQGSKDKDIDDIFIV